MSEGVSDTPNSITKCVADESLRAMLEGSSKFLDEAKDCVKKNMDKLSPSQQQQW